MRMITPLKLFTVMGMASLAVACQQSSDPPAARPPLPQDSFSANPASPNCYPDINHCASYPSGGITKDNPVQQPQQK